MANAGASLGLLETLKNGLRDWLFIVGLCGGSFIVNVIQLVSREWLGADLNPDVNLIVTVLDLMAIAMIVSNTLLVIRRQWTGR